MNPGSFLDSSSGNLEIIQVAGWMNSGVDLDALSECAGFIQEWYWIYPGTA